MKTIKAIAAFCILVPVTVFAQVNTPRVDQRESRQEARIQRGVASGDLTRQEAMRLERGQQRVANIEARAKSDGVVTSQERQRLHQAQQVQSRHIYNQKHDRQHDYNREGRRDMPRR